jgi:phosphoribosyl-ATP pyrophosphohydrolase/phosphoribosyl-AMP cyclohydrolase/histidinol dehydrogenase
VLPTRAVAAVSVAKGFCVVCASLEEAAAVTDRLAPEHLEVQVAPADVDALWARLANYGGLFLGAGTAEVFGDYGAGPNHVLPTSGTARYTGGLSVFTFLRVRTWLRAGGAAGAGQDQAGLDLLVRDSAALARLEGLYGHEAAALARGSDAVLAEIAREKEEEQRAT